MHNINKKLGNRYTLLEKVGDGGMALVYKAKCELLNRYVAVKVLRPEYMSDEDFLKKFRSESLAVASLSHQNIVNVYDVGNEDGLNYIVMEYVEGIDLKDYIKKKGSLDYKETLDIIKQIAKALEHAHKNGVVHRDIKPQNILITEEGLVKVADFGIARASTASTMTNTKTVLGSVHYVSPEQAKGSFTDNRTDIYSIGIVMYELLTGQLPFEGDSPISIAIKHIQDEIKNPCEIKEGIPKGVCDICVKCTQKDPLKRYQNLTDMINDINIVQKSPNTRVGLFSSEIEGTRIIPLEELEKAMNDRTMKIDTSKYNKPKEEIIDDEDIIDDFEDFEEEVEEDIEEDKYKFQRKKKLKEKSKGKVGKRRKAIVGTVIGLSLFILGIVGAFAMWMGNTPKEFIIPKVIGETKEVATQKLAAGKLVVKTKEVESDEKAGLVVDIYPAEGMPVKEKSEVTLTISKGKETVQVPNIEGITVEEAERQLIEKNLLLGDVTREYSSDVGAGLVIEQSEKEGTEVEQGSKIDVVISKGPEIKFSKVPSLVGKTLDEAKSAIKNAGLTIGSIGYSSNPAYPNNVVLEQTISGGTSVKKGSSIDIIINKVEEKDKDEGGTNDKVDEDKEDQNKDENTKPENGSGESNSNQGDKTDKKPQNQ